MITANIFYNIYTKFSFHKHSSFVIDSGILKQNDHFIITVLIFNNEKLNAVKNSILTPLIEFLQATERFKTMLFN